MSTITINPNPAQDITAETAETFETFADRVYKTSKHAIRHGNGQPIEINAGSKYSVLVLELADIATVEQFNRLMAIMMQSVEQAVADGVIPADWFKGVATPFNLFPPAIPEQYHDADHVIKTYLVGETGFVLVKESIVEEPQPDTEQNPMLEGRA